MYKSIASSISLVLNQMLKIIKKAATPIKDIYNNKRKILSKRSDLKEEYIKDKFFIRILDKSMKLQFPMGYEIKHSIIKEAYTQESTHWISAKGEIDNNLYIYSANRGTDPDKVLKETMKKIEECKNIYEDAILTNTKFSRMFLVDQIIMSTDYNKHESYTTLKIEELKELVNRAMKKNDKQKEVYKVLMNKDYEKISKKEVNRALREYYRASKKFIQTLRVEYKRARKKKV